MSFCENNVVSSVFKVPSQAWDNRKTHKHAGIDTYCTPCVCFKFEKKKTTHTSDIVEQIKSCGKEKDLFKTRKIHSGIFGKNQITKDIHLAIALIRSYSKCGSPREAREVFDQLQYQDVVSWTAIIAGYVENGLTAEALKCLFEMENQGVSPNALTYCYSIKACTISKSLDIGERIHARVKERGLLKRDVVLGTALVNMYAKCGSLDKMQEVFSQLGQQDVVSWNSIIAGYVENGRSNEALKCFQLMEDEGFSPNSVTYICTLKACSLGEFLEFGEKISAKVREKGLVSKNVMLANTLISMYAKCGEIQKSCEVFDQLHQRDVVSWNALISGYVENGLGNEALELFLQMQDEGVFPDSITYIYSLKACTIEQSLDIGEKIHAQVNKQQLLNDDIVLGNALVEMFAKCGAIKKAQKVFDQLQQRNVASWNAIVLGYIENGLGDQGLKCLTLMEDEGLFPDSTTYVYILKACALKRFLEVGEHIHRNVRKQGLLSDDTRLGNALINMYVKCGAVIKAQEVFDQIQQRNVVSWNALINGYVMNGLCDQALTCFSLMENEKICPDQVTYICVLKACAILRCVQIGEKIHARVSEQGLLHNNILLGSVVIDMFAKCGALHKAREVLDHLPLEEVVCWNALLSGYIENGRSDLVLECFREMVDKGFLPDVVTYTYTLKACAILRSLNMGENVHARIEQQGLLNKDIILGNTLVYMYSKCGTLKKACEVFKQLPQRDVVSWNVLMAGYLENGYAGEALECFVGMQEDGIAPDTVAYTYMLKACAILGHLSIAEEIDARVRQEGLISKDIWLGNTLADMYAKCSLISKAREIFDQLPQRNVISWNVLMAGYGRLGEVKVTLDSFKRMMAEGIAPNAATFTILINACCHAALLEGGEKFFNDMTAVYGVAPSIEQYTCMIDLLGRAGQFDKAKLFLLNEVPLFLAFLGACSKWANVDHGRWAFDRLMELDKKCDAAYVSMANIYVAAGQQTEAEKIEAFRIKHRAWKIPG